MNKHTVGLAAVAILVSGMIAPAAWSQNTVQTVAGGGPNNLPALKSSLGAPDAVAIDGAGNVFLADLFSERVFKVDTTGNVTLVAGNGARSGLFGNSGDGGPAIDANITFPSGVAVDAVGNIFIADRSYCRVREVAAQTGFISTVAGTGNCWYSGDGGPATSAALNEPSGVAVDRFGNIFITDTWNCLVREVSGSTGIISTLAGTAPDTTGLLHCGYSGDGGPAASAKVGFPNGVAVDSSGNVFIADTTNCAVRMISTSNHNITTVGGTGTCGFSGDGGPAASAQLSQTYGVAVDHFGNIFIADTVNCVVREVSASDAQISTVAGEYSLGCGYSGDGASATNGQLNQPYGVAVNGSGNILIADYKNAVIREVSASTAKIFTYAGVAVPDPLHGGKLIGLNAYSGDGYPAVDAELGFLNNSPFATGMSTDRSGNVYIADTANHAIRKVSASTGIITTVAGNGLIGYAGDGGLATDAALFYPRDVTVDGAGNIIIMDTGNCVVRKITAATGIIATVAGTLPDSSGNYYCGYSGDGGPATSAQLYPIDLLTPAGGVAVDSAGNIFIADTGNRVIRKVSASDGSIATVAGNALSLSVGEGDGGPATSATLNTPYGVAVDSTGNIYIADTGDDEIREVMAVNGNIYTVAGTLDLGLSFSGDGGPPGLAHLREVYGVFLDPSGNLFIPDPGNCVIREVSASTGDINTVAGTPNTNGDYSCGFAGDGGPALSALFDFPAVASADAAGNLVILDSIRVRSVAGLVGAPAAGAVLFPNPLVFSNPPVGISSTLTVVLSNRGALATSVSTVAISGANASDFVETNGCVGHSLNGGGGSCAINVKFTPSVAALESAQLTVTDGAGTQIVDLSGTAVDAPDFSQSASTLPFGNQQEGVKSSDMSITVTNSGYAGLTVSNVALNGNNAGDFTISANTCSAGTVAVNASCSVSVAFSPTTTGAESASLQFTDNAPGSPHSVGLTGTGTDFSIGIAPGGSAAASVPAGNSATYNLQVTPISGFNGPVALSCTGAPTDSTCTPSEASATPNGSAAAIFSIQVTTVARSMASTDVRPRLPFGGWRVRPMVLMIALAAMLLAFPFRFRGESPQLRTAYAFAIAVGFLFLAIIVAGCGSTGNGAPPPLGGTPAGNYTLTVTGTSHGVTRSQTVTLTVN